MQNQISAYVPRRLILKEVMGQLNLNVHGTGMLPFGFDQYIAWMCVDLPRYGEAGKDGDTVLYSDPALITTMQKRMWLNQCLSTIRATERLRSMTSIRMC